MRKNKISLTILALFFVIMGLFFLFLIGYNRKHIGGDATSGYKKESTYYIKMENSDAYKEVSAKVWYSNYILSVLAIFFLILGMFGYAFILIKFTFSLFKKHFE